jgi:hypothetical protein
MGTTAKESSTVLNNFLSEIVLVAGLGTLLDSVFVSKEERERIEKYLESGTKDLTLNVRFSHFLFHAHAIVFGRFFSGRLFSLKFFCSAAMISLISFLTTISLQIYFFPEQFSQIRFDATQYILFAAFIAFNIIFDYATIIQTKIFIEASIAAKSIFRALVFIGSDLIVTLNTFILSYAFFVLLIVQVFIADRKEATVILSDSPPAETIDQSTPKGSLAKYVDRDFMDKVKFFGGINGALMPNRDRENAKNITVYYYSSFDPQDARLQGAILTNLSALNLTNLDLEQVENPQELQEYTETLMRTRSELQRQLNKDSEDRKVFLLSFSVDGSVIEKGSMTGAYTAAFYLTDQLEDAFPLSLLSPLELPLVSTLIEASAASPYPGLNLAICFENGTPVSRMLISEETIEVLNSCQEFVLVENFWVNAFEKDLALIGRDTEGYRVPFNTLLITSVLPTAFFYLAIMLLAITSLCFSKLVKGTNRVKRFFLRAPLSISGLLLGVILSLTGMI